MDKPNNKTVSAIISVLNEEKTVKNIVSQLLSFPLIHEVICVIDNGSTDNSLSLLKTFDEKIHLLQIGQQNGKGNAMVEGIKKATGDIIAFFDADITNLTEYEIEKMLKPLQNNSVRVVLGYPKARHYFAKLFLPLTGERVYYKKDLIPHLENMKNLGYGVEVYLNKQFLKNETAIVHLDNLLLLEKREKHGFIHSLRDEMRATMQLSREIGLELLNFHKKTTV